MKDKLLSRLGMCRKAGKLQMGFDVVAESARKQQVFLILLAQDLSPKRAKDIEWIGRDNNIPVVRVPLLMDEIWYRLGRRAGILAVAHQGFADTIEATVSCVDEEDLVQ